MKDVARQLSESGPAVEAAEGAVSPAALEQAYEALDPLLTTLKKQLADLLYQVERRRVGGLADDPMYDVLCDMVDSARSAYDTRLIELKARADIQTQVKDMVKAAARAEAEQARLLLAQNYRVKMNEFYSRLRQQAKVRRAKKEAEDGLFTALVLFSMLQWTVGEAHRRLRLASVFMQASGTDLTERDMRTA